MAEDDKKDPAQKMRYLINGGKPSPVARLPKKDGGAAAFLRKLKNDKKTAAAPEPELTKSKLTQPEPPIQTTPRPDPLQGAVSTLKGLKLNFGPPFWTCRFALNF